MCFSTVYVYLVKALNEKGKVYENPFAYESVCEHSFYDLHMYFPVHSYLINTKKKTKSPEI